MSGVTIVIAPDNLPSRKIDTFLNLSTSDGNTISIRAAGPVVLVTATSLDQRRCIAGAATLRESVCKLYTCAC
jgi:hypothetical protein